MEKAKLTATVSKWVDTKSPREEAETDNGKVRHNVYISKQASKLLWQCRVDTRVPVSRIINNLIIKHLGSKNL